MVSNDEFCYKKTVADVLLELLPLCLQLQRFRVRVELRVRIWVRVMVRIEDFWVRRFWADSGTIKTCVSRFTSRICLMQARESIFIAKLYTYNMYCVYIAMKYTIVKSPALLNNT